MMFLAECRFFGREVISNKTKRTQPIGLPGGPGLTSRGDHEGPPKRSGIEHKLMWGSKSGWVYDFENFMVYGLDLVKTSADKIQSLELKLSGNVGNAPCDRKPPILPSKTRKKADFRRFSLWESGKSIKSITLPPIFWHSTYGRPKFSDFRLRWR